MNKCPICQSKWPCKAEMSKKMTEKKMLHIYALRLQGTSLSALSNMFDISMDRADEICEHVKSGFKSELD